MHEHPGAVDALPVEVFIGEAVGVVPAQLGGQEIVNRTALHNLWNRRAVTKGIGQPEAVGGIAELLAVVPLAPEELADHRLAGGDVAVTLHPDGAVRLVASLGDFLANALEQRGVVPADQLGVIGRALDELVFGILFHEV